MLDCCDVLMEAELEDDSAQFAYLITPIELLHMIRDKSEACESHTLI